MKSHNEKMFFYDRFASEFDSKMNMYDTNRRLDVVFKEFLTEDMFGLKFLDVGSGTGWFSKEAALRGANVYSLDVGENILAEVTKKCNSTRIIGDALDIPFDDDYFDIVLSTEVIEHTANPKKAVKEMCRVLKKNGILIITVPNKMWYPIVVIANFIKIRPYEGYENWVGWFELKKWLNEFNLSILSMKGLHLFPFILPSTYKLLTKIDRYGKLLGPIMINICVKALKK